MIFVSLFITFFEIGLFGFGGGYGMLSLIQHETVEVHHWLSTSEFTDIVAISQMTPGPIGINSATYCGYTAIHNAGYGHLASILGSATATFALVLPSLILMILISKMFMKYMNTSLVQSIFTGLWVCWQLPPCCFATPRTSLHLSRILGSLVSVAPFLWLPLLVQVILKSIPSA